ncbi:hypothetical protein BN2475_490026 [Paraburkholderia ribeironis]|uniref:Uncharacterized protein n=1 Tax=Paraburkholderia ribeironis TaxID=1247936 RepID=A0A1N7SBN0_9BURK|nr:hypothetical protein BN2475_490026 [Paraburkholderia ribeironis]
MHREGSRVHNLVRASGASPDLRIQFIEQVEAGSDLDSTRVIKQYWNGRSTQLLAGLALLCRER